MKQLLFVINPRSGKGKIKTKLGDVIELFNNYGYEVDVHLTRRPMDAYETVVAKGNRYNKIVCSGGDGTVDEVISGMIDGRIYKPLGYIPAGTTNDFAKSIGISRNIMAAAKNAAIGKPFAYDIGRFNRRSFAYVAAFGVFSDVAYETSQKLKKAMGYLAYILSSFRSFWSMKSYYMEVEIAGKIYKDRFIYGQISNARYIGGIKTIKSDTTEFDDGLFEVMLIRQPKSINDFRNLLGALMLQNIEPRHMIYARTNNVKIHSRISVAWTLDGEYAGEHRNVHAAIMNKAVRILRPAEYNNPKTALREYEICGIKGLVPPLKGEISKAFEPYESVVHWDEETAEIIVPDLEYRIRRMMKRYRRSYSECEYILTMKSAGRDFIKKNGIVMDMKMAVKGDEAYIYAGEMPEGCTCAGSKATLRIIDGKVYGYMTPWNNSDPSLAGKCFEVKGIIFNKDAFISGSELGREEACSKLQGAMTANLSKGYEEQLAMQAVNLQRVVKIY